MVLKKILRQGGERRATVKVPNFLSKTNAFLFFVILKLINFIYNNIREEHNYREEENTPTVFEKVNAPISPAKEKLKANVIRLVCVCVCA